MKFIHHAHDKISMLFFSVSRVLLIFLILRLVTAFVSRPVLFSLLVVIGRREKKPLIDQEVTENFSQTILFFMMRMNNFRAVSKYFFFLCRTNYVESLEL